MFRRFRIIYCSSRILDILDILVSSSCPALAAETAGPAPEFSPSRLIAFPPFPPFLLSAFPPSRLPSLPTFPPPHPAHCLPRPGPCLQTLKPQTSNPGSTELAEVRPQTSSLIVSLHSYRHHAMLSSWKERPPPSRGIAIGTKSSTPRRKAPGRPPPGRYDTITGSAT
jgi:hypothetical protein